jgi:hypothetical protein
MTCYLSFSTYAPESAKEKYQGHKPEKNDENHRKHSHRRTGKAIKQNGKERQQYGKRETYRGAAFRLFFIRTGIK